MNDFKFNDFSYLLTSLPFRTAIHASHVTSLILFVWSAIALAHLEIAASAPASTKPILSSLSKTPIEHLEDPMPGATFQFRATAYCLNGITASGVPVAPGIAAADPSVLPLGTLIHVQAPGLDGVYQILDTGLKIKGKRIDIYMPSKEMALEFGIHDATVTVLNYGGDYQARSPVDP